MDDMVFRKLMCEVEELQGIKEVNSKKSERFKVTILEAGTGKEQLKNIFEDLFFEMIEDTVIKVFIDKYKMLTQEQRETYIDDMLNRYKEYGEYGFVTIALGSLKGFEFVEEKC